MRSGAPRSVARAMISGSGRLLLLGNDYNYTYGPASKYKESRPCTNVIIECPECAKTKGKKPMGQYFWKYVCMETHWARMHSTVEKPAALVEAPQIAPRRDRKAQVLRQV